MLASKNFHNWEAIYNVVEAQAQDWIFRCKESNACERVEITEERKPQQATMDYMIAPYDARDNPNGMATSWDGALTDLKKDWDSIGHTCDWTTSGIHESGGDINVVDPN